LAFNPVRLIGDDIYPCAETQAVKASSWSPVASMMKMGGKEQRSSLRGVDINGASKKELDEIYNFERTVEERIDNNVCLDEIVDPVDIYI
jgi:hypothetical protein